MSATEYREPFKILEFINPRTKSQSWRVSGFRRDGTRVRENFNDLTRAEGRKLNLTTEWLSKHQETTIRATKLTDHQIKLAEIAFSRLDSDDDLLPAVEHWRHHGKQNAVAESPRIDDATKHFLEWLEKTDSLRHQTKRNLDRRITIFRNSVPNLKVCDVTPDTIDSFLDKRKCSATSKDNDRRAVSRFFSWCMDRKRRWATVNPCHVVKVERGERPKPSILTVEECEKLLRKAQSYKRGLMAPYFAVCMFGGLRPWEAQRLTSAQVNLTDREIRLEEWQTKTKTSRVVKMCGTLHAWLKKYKGKQFYPPNWRKHFIEVERAAGYGPGLKPLPPDVMRHTAISHYFRNSGSYGLTAEWAGNSEAIIKAHYQGRVSSEDTKKFYAITPR